MNNDFKEFVKDLAEAGLISYADRAEHLRLKYQFTLMDLKQAIDMAQDNMDGRKGSQEIINLLKNG